MRDVSSKIESMGYTLVVCEKPDAARRVSEALSSRPPRVSKVGDVSVFHAAGAGGREYVVCAAAGHLYGISDVVKDRRVYPVADVEWFPLSAVRKKGVGFVSGRIRAFSVLAKGADAFVNACDLDIEGETIGYNILRYACGGKEVSAKRARFSSLTNEEVASAFSDERLGSSDGSAVAGRLRHEIDFLWGVNLSRALSESFRSTGSFRTISMGRVQGPTLNFAVEREVEIKTFVPIPYWTVAGTFAKGGVVFEAKYSSSATLATKSSAEDVKAACEGREGVVSSASRRRFSQRPPPPFNLADLQKEAFRVIGYTPSRTLQVAQKLYLAAVISYPRTASQRLPKSDHKSILSKIGAVPGYSEAVNEILSRGVLHPVQGQGADPAHPAIYPTGETAKRSLGTEEAKVYDLVVRRFLSCFGEDAVREVTVIKISVGTHEFEVEETAVLSPGWLKLIGTQRHGSDRAVGLPELKEGEKVECKSVLVDEHLRAPPSRFNQMTLLEKMEGEGIGTKATRADIISTLLERGYVVGQTLAPTDLGFAVIESMRVTCPQIISTRLTREIEAQLESMELTGMPRSEFFEQTLSTLVAQLGEIRVREGEIASRMRGSLAGGSPGRVVLGRCPVCKEGELWVVRSRTSGKRFVGCTNYSKGCKASAPLPQRGAIKVAAKPCGRCGWPVVYVRYGRRPWKLCVNDRCPGKVNVYAMRGQAKRAA